MLRRWSALAAIVAVLCGVGATPYTHAHHAIDSVADDHHPRGATLVHSHIAPHEDRHDHESGRESDHRETADDPVWSVAPFVAHQQAVSSVYVPLAVNFVPALPHVEPTTVRIERDRPRAHAPPPARSLSLRAPPSLLPILL